MATVVLDAGNMDAILKDAGYEAPEPKEVTNEDGKAAASEGATKTDEKAVGSVTPAVEKVIEGDEEDENGLTAAEKAELSAKIQKTIGKKHRMLREAEEFAASQYNERKLAEQRAADLQREIESLRGAKKTEIVQEAKKPSRADFATESEYIDASISWGVDEGLRKKAAEDAQAAAQRAQDAMLQAAQARIEAAIGLVPDFKEVVDGADMIVPPAIAGYMQKSDMFAEIGYHLAKNPDLLVSLSKLQPDEQLVKLGRIESTLQPFAKASAKAEEVKETKDGIIPSKDTAIQPSKARAPVISPLNSSGNAAIEVNPENVREVINDFAKKNGVKFAARKRH